MYYTNLLTIVIRKATCRRIRSATSRPTRMATNQEPESNRKICPEKLSYTHLWVSKDGETHLQKGRMKNCFSKGYSSDVEQVIKDDNPEPTRVVFTTIGPNTDNPWHSCPSVQYVICMSGKQPDHSGCIYILSCGKSLEDNGFRLD